MIHNWGSGLGKRVPVHPGLPVRILQISGNEANRRELERLLRSTNWELTQVPSLEEAILRVQPAEGYYSIVLCERTMPTRRWRALFVKAARIRTLPMFVVTVPLGDTRCWAEALSSGADDVIATPLERAELVWVVREAHLAWLRHLESRRRRPAAEVA